MKKIYISALALILGAGVNAQVLNPSFENWEDFEPDHWETLWFLSETGSTTDGNGNIIIPATEETDNPTHGNSYIKLTSYNYVGAPEDIFDSRDYGSFAIQDFASTTKYQNFTFDVSYDIKTGDAAIIVIEAVNNNDDVVGKGFQTFTGTQASLTTTTIPMTYQEDVVGYVIYIVSSEAEYDDNATTTITPGSWIGVDNIVVGDVVSTSEEEMNQLKVEVYPNPANDNVNFKIDKLQKGEITIHSVLGQVALKTSIESGIKMIDVSQLNNGVYIYTVHNQNGELIKTDKLIIRK